MKNDSSFILGDVMNLYEHQSSMRGFLYFELYRKYMDEKGLDLYDSSPVKVPLPRYTVFYNGQGKEPNPFLYIDNKGEKQYVYILMEKGIHMVTQLIQPLIGGK